MIRYLHHWHSFEYLSPQISDTFSRFPFYFPEAAVRNRTCRISLRKRLVAQHTAASPSVRAPIGFGLESRRRESNPHALSTEEDCEAVTQRRARLFQSSSCSGETPGCRGVSPRFPNSFTPGSRAAGGSRTRCASLQERPVTLTPRRGAFYFLPFQSNVFGAVGGNRTRVASVEDSRSATELRPLHQRVFTSLRFSLHILLFRSGRRESNPHLQLGTLALVH